MSAETDTSYDTSEEIPFDLFKPVLDYNDIGECQGAHDTSCCMSPRHVPAAR